MQNLDFEIVAGLTHPVSDRNCDPGNFLSSFVSSEPINQIVCIVIKAL